MFDWLCMNKIVTLTEYLVIYGLMYFGHHRSLALLCHFALQFLLFLIVIR